jgi:hypothetical protein
MILLSSCDKNPLFSSTESISKILESPSKYHDKVVSVKGKVTESIVVFGVGYFVLSDRTSSIVVSIPTQIGHPFRSNPAGHSEANRPPSD